jgi:hypothetical protein
LLLLLLPIGAVQCGRRCSAGLLIVATTAVAPVNGPKYGPS